MSSPNTYMYEGKWLDLKQYRIAKGLDPKPAPPKNVRSTESLLKEKKALDTIIAKKELKQTLKDAGEDVEEYEEVVTVEIPTDEPKLYTGEKPVEDMDYFEMLKTVKELGHVFEKKLTKKQAYDILIKQ